MNNWLLVLLVTLSATSLVVGWLAFRQTRRTNGSGRTKVPTGLGAALLPLSFKEALNFDRAPELLKANFLRQINSGLSPGLDSAIVAFQLIDIAQSRDIILAKFPDAASQLLKQGKAVLLKTKGGEEMLTATVAGKFHAHARKIDPTVAHHLAKVGPLIVGAAHIIAGYDNAKKLKQIDKKLDLLISHRSRDMASELEAIFESIKESFASASLESQDLTHLRSLRYKLKRLRCGWINQIEAALQDLKNPANRGFLETFFSTKRGTAQNIECSLSQQEEPLYLTRFALNMEQYIATLLCEETSFENVTTPGVRKQVQAVRALILERRKWIEEALPNMKESVAEAIICLDNFESSLGSAKAEGSEQSNKEEAA